MLNQDITRILDSFVEHTNSLLLNSDAGLSYLLGRGVDKTQIERHKIGLLIEPYEIEDTYDCLCLGDHCDVCRFKNWIQHHQNKLKSPDFAGGFIVFPLSGESKATYGLQTRSILKKSFDTFMVTSRPEPVFFGTAANVMTIYNYSSVVLCEGPLDMLVMERNLSSSCLALTTNQPNTSQGKFIKRYCDTVILCLDADPAGVKGSKYVMDLFMGTIQTMNVRLSNPWGCKDPNDLWRKLGDVKLRSFLRKQINGHMRCFDRI